MYSSYKTLKSRSKSTTDLFHATSPEAVDGYSTLSRPGRRRVAPAPPRRTDSLLSVHDVASQKRAREILAEDIRWQFSSSPGKVSPGQSPRSNSFVRRLVESLERKQREGATESPSKRTGWSFGARRGQEAGVGARESLLPEEEQVTVKRVTREHAFARLRPNQLEDLQERENESEDSFDHQDFAMHRANTEPLFLHETNNNYIGKNYPNKESSYDTTKNPTKRSLKNILSSIISWKNAKNLPKSIHGYYNAWGSPNGNKFTSPTRRSTAPQLVQTATQVRPAGRHGPGRSCSVEREGPAPRITDEPPPPRIYGEPVVKDQAAGYRQIVRSAGQYIVEAAQESRKAEGAPAPVGPDSPPSAEHLLRPSKLRELQQRRLSRPEPPPRQQQPAAPVIYDVPRSNRRVLPEVPQYANLGVAPSKQRRSAMFTNL